MFNEDDFFLDDDELAEDNQLSLVDSARLNLLESIKKSCEDMIENLKFNEQSEAFNNTRIIAGYVDSLINLGSIEINNLSEEEIYDEIEKVMTATTTLTFGNINEILPDEEETTNNMSADSDDDADGTDW